jgi:hypothetical protein
MTTFTLRVQSRPLDAAVRAALMTSGWSPAGQSAFSFTHAGVCTVLQLDASTRSTQTLTFPGDDLGQLAAQQLCRKGVTLPLLS